jgi:hypothetical protein
LNYAPNPRLFEKRKKKGKGITSVGGVMEKSEIRTLIQNYTPMHRTEELKAGTRTDTCTPMFPAAL